VKTASIAKSVGRGLAPAVFQRIYDLCASGHGSPYIAKVLNREGVLTPRNHREATLPGYVEKRQYEWTPETVHGILRSRIYKGDMVQGIYDCARFKRIPSKRKPSDEWLITPNTHDPIVSDELWHYVQNCMNTRKRVQRSGEPQLSGGFIRCGDCGYALAFASRYGTEYYSCGLYRRKGLEKCTQHYINKQTLIELVLDDIRKYALIATENMDRLASKLAAQNGDKEDRQIQSLTANLTAAEARYAELDGIIEQLYEDKVSGEITEARFRKLTARYEAEQQAKEKAISENKSKIERTIANKKDAAAWLELIRGYADIRELDRVVLGELIEKITVGEAQVIDGVKNIEVTIYYRFVGAVTI